MIGSFDGKYAFLSNFYNTPVVFEGDMYENSESAFQAAKLLDRSERKAFFHTAPNIAKRMGRKASLRKDWEDVKVEIMRQIVEDKFRRNPEIARKLLATGEEDLVEGNTWNDCFWGVCRGHGENHLGIILMEVREILRKEKNGYDI